MATLLRSRVAVAHGDRAVFERLEIYRDARGRTYFILPTVALADVAVVVPHYLRYVFFKRRVYFARLCDELGLVLEERKDRRFDRRDLGIEFEECAGFSAELVFRVSGSEEGEDGALKAERRLNDVRDDGRLTFSVDHRERRSCSFRMRREVEIGAIRQA